MAAVEPSSSEEMERILSFFIDPDNDEMDYNHFIESILRTTLGKEIQSPSASHNRLISEINRLFEDVKKARRFNERYLGHELSEACIPAMVGYMLALRLGSNTVAREVSIQESNLEPEAINGLMNIVGYSPSIASGTFTSGGSISAFTALLIARKKMQMELNAKGVRAEHIVVLSTRMAHYSLQKAVDYLGGPNQQITVRNVATNQYKMSIIDLENNINLAMAMRTPIMAVFAIAGETETGLVDPLGDIIELCKKYEIFCIADGAYGAPYRISKVGNLFHGIENFDCVTIDGHKALYTPYSNGAVLFKDARDHALLPMLINAAYVGFEAEENADFEIALENSTRRLLHNEGGLGEKRVEGSAGAGPILSTVAVLRTLGLQGLSTLYNHTLDRTQHLYELVQASDYLEPFHKPDLNLLCFGLKPEIQVRLGIRTTQEYKEFINKSRIDLDKNLDGDGGYFFSYAEPYIENTNISYPVWRACIMHPRTTDGIIDDAIHGLESIISKSLFRNRDRYGE